MLRSRAASSGICFTFSANAPLTCTASLSLSPCPPLLIIPLTQVLGSLPLLLLRFPPSCSSLSSYYASTSSFSPSPTPSSFLLPQGCRHRTCRIISSPLLLPVSSPPRLGDGFLFAPPCVHTLGRLHTQTSARWADAPLPRDPSSALPIFLVPEARSFLPRACPLGQPTRHVFARLMRLCPKIISVLSCWLFFSFQGPR